MNSVYYVSSTKFIMSGEDYITRSFSKYYSGGQIKKNEMCGACRTYEGEEKCIEGFGEET